MPPLTLFSIPKAFEGHIGVIQRNAITSWTLLKPQPEVILFGDDSGIEEFAADLGILHVPDVHKNEQGTPILSDIFRQTHELATSEILCYVNSDIILFDDFLRAVEQVTDSMPDDFLMIGRRIDTDITEQFDFRSVDWRQRVLQRMRSASRLAPRVCKDYFVFPKRLFQELPDFAVGRGNWDNWIVYHAHRTKTPVVDATRVTTVLHQNHSYSHLKMGRAEAYVKGIEANTNRTLAGGTHLVKGSSANWVLTTKGLRRSRMPSAMLLFLADLPRFMGLLSDLIVPGRSSNEVNVE